MTKGIREFVNAKFAEKLPKLGELGGKEFRRSVMQAAIDHFSISIASAATHYNHALKVQRAANPESVEGLGRPEDKKGGRKPKTLMEVIKVKTGEVVATGLSKAAAEEMVSRAAAAKKAKLEIRVVAKEEAPTEAQPAEAATA